VAGITKPKPGTTFQDGYKKGKSESLSNLEKEAIEKYEIEVDPENPLQGLDLIDHIVTTKAKPGKGTGLTDDAVKAHPVYQAAERQWKKTLKDKETEFETQKTEIETRYKKDQVFNTVSGKALGVLAKMNPILPTNAEVAKTWQENFVNSFKEYEFEEQDGGHILVKKDGKVVDDGHGNTVDFETLVKSRAPKFFEFKANNGGANAGNGKAGDSGNQGGGGTGTGNYPANVTKPKTFEDLSKIMSDSAIPLADRQTVKTTWDTEQAQAASGKQ
jgi:hypothetical protein